MKNRALKLALEIIVTMIAYFAIAFAFLWVMPRGAQEVWRVVVHGAIIGCALAFYRIVTNKLHNL